MKPSQSCLFPVVLWAGLNAGLLRADSLRVTNRFQFRLPQPLSCRVERDSSTPLAAGKVEWLRAQLADGSTNFVELGSRVVLQVESPGDWQRLIAGRALQLSRAVASNVFILQAPDAWTAAQEAGRLATLPEVSASYPVVRQQAGVHSPYAEKPAAVYFGLYQLCFGQYYNLGQYYFENRNPLTGDRWGADINVRSAWPVTRGAGVTVAVVDSGFETDHPDLSIPAGGAPHFNFETGTANGNPPTTNGVNDIHNHGTAVAGFIAAQATNSLSILGAAPDAKLASWVIFGTNSALVSDEVLMEVYQHLSNSVAVQNHSWGQADGAKTLFPETLLENVGISNAVTFGRSGRGVVLVRSCGNNRPNANNSNVIGNANDDAHCSDPRVIGVASVRVGGRAANYSNPGASILVSAVGGQSGEAYELTTDRQASRGYSSFQLSCPINDPNFGNFYLSFYGTSAAAPQIAGIAALMLSVNPNLTYRDVQQILILSARHFDFADPDLKTNGVGLPVSHNVGFGIPDAGAAVQLALAWTNRPAPASVTITRTNVVAIPDDGLRALVGGAGVPPNLASVRCLPGTGPHTDTPTPALPLVDFGFGANPGGFNLTNQAALIQRGTNTFEAKISNAAAAGAAFAVIYNFPTNAGADGGDTLLAMGATDFVPIPAVFIGNTDGEALKALFATNTAALAQIRLNSTNCVFNVTNTWLCEHVGLRVQSDHPLRGDLRITLVSPMGTRSVLQAYNLDTNAGPADWTYWSTHHFFEGSAGDWTAGFSDEGAGSTGSVLHVSLTIEGVPITDTDHDGLDDNWEYARLNNLSQGPKDDPDLDGYSNMREQIMDTDPAVANPPFRLDLSRWNQNLARLSWPASSNFTYEILSGTNVTFLTPATNLPGQFPEAEWFMPYTNLSRQFFRVQAVPVP